MKKIFIILIAVMVLLSSVSLAEDLSSMSDEDLLELYKRVTEEMASRGISSRQEDPDPESAEEARETSGSTVLYYSPEGGQYYHANRNCQTVHEQYLPLMESFTYAELEDEPYKDLQPCSVCGAPLRPESQDRAVSFRDAADAAGEFVSIGGDLDYLTVVTEKNGKYIRTVTLPDDHARELYMAAMGAEDSGEAFETYQTYAWSLPVAYTEELTAKPKEQAELDAQDGKTVGQLLEEGYSLYGIGGSENLPTTVTLSYSLFNYEFETDASFEQYRGDEGWEGLEEMKVKGGRLSGFSGIATDPDYLADGTYKPQAAPHVTAEEAAAADRVLPADEYTMKAWPLTAESYAELLNNTEGRYGQSYMIEGVVHQVLSQSPLRIIINSGEDGKSQPVVVEYPAHSSFSPEEGVYYRIYADVTSSCYILPVLTARYSFTGPDADPADEPASLSEAAFIAPNVIPAKGIEDFLGEWHYFRIVNEDGSEMSREEMLAEGIVDDHAEIIVTVDEIVLYAASMGDAGSVKYEFIPDDGSLKILNGAEELPVLRLTDNGMLMFSMPAYGSPSGSTTAYLVRGEP